jgi:hypothetical protein
MRPGTSFSIASVTVVIGASVAVTAGCALDPVQPTRDPSARPPSPAAAPSQTSSRRTPNVTATATASSTGFSEYVASNCNGRPSANQVIAVVRPKLKLAANVQVTVTTGPTCSGKWQYTVLSVPGREQVHVVTSGEPTALTVLAAGTNPCIPYVRVNAPAGIRAVLNCDTVSGT